MRMTNRKHNDYDKLSLIMEISVETNIKQIMNENLMILFVFPTKVTAEQFVGRAGSLKRPL